MNRLETTVIVGNTRGVHGRVATRLAEIAANHQVCLTLTREAETVDCASILDVLALALVQGTAITLQAEGEQAGVALAVARKVLMEQDDG